MSESAENVEGREPNRETSSNENREQHRRGGRGGRNRNRGGNQTTTQHSSGDASLNLGELREIADLFKEYGLTDFEFENENVRVRFRKEMTTPTSFTQYAPAPPLTVAAQNPSPQQQSSAPVSAPPVNSAAQIAETPSDANVIKSPIVGTFYRSPSPEADAFVKIGSQVTPTSIVCIVEAMKLMNEIEAEMSGEITQIYVENGQPVEYGQPLFAVK